jgi:ABC-type nickel/cobalt efflux system permease component RcnA
MLYYRPAPGVLALLTGGLLSVLAVATGLYFPLDLVAGLAVGAIVFAAAYWLRRWLRLPIRMIILGASNYSSVFYPLGVLVMLDSTQQFLGVSQVIEWLFRVPLVR